MKTIAIASQKGGSGKTTLALHLSVLAQEAGPTLLVDMDPQASLGFWHTRRQAASPILIPTTAAGLKVAIDAAKGEGIAFTIIDTAPHDSAAMATAMRAADFVVIPCRPAALDLHAVGATIDMAKSLRKPNAVVLNSTPARRGFGEPAAVAEAREVIEGQGGSVAPFYIVQRTIAGQSIIAGLAVQEIEPDGQAAKEYRALWRWIGEQLR